MGLGRLLKPRAVEQTRALQYAVSDTVSGQLAVYTVVDSLGPDWPSSDPFRGAMGIPGCWRAANLLADLLGQVPWDGFRHRADDADDTLHRSHDDTTAPARKIRPRPTLLDQPSPPETRHSTISSWMLDYLWNGNAIGVITGRDWRGVPTACLPQASTSVAVRRVPRNDPEKSDRRPGSIEYKIGNETFGHEDIIHIKGPCAPGALRGMGILETQLVTLNLAKDQQRQASNVANHGVPTGLLKSDNPDLDEVEATDLKAKWMAARASGGIAVLNATTEFQPLSWNPTELQMVEARRLTVSDIELIFGFPVGWLGGMNSARQYSNVEMDAVNLLKFTLSGHLSRFEQTFSLLYPRGTHVRADLDVILRADILTRFKAYEIGIKNGILLRSEARNTEHLPPVDRETIQRESEIAQMLAPKPAIGGGQDGGQSKRPTGQGSAGTEASNGNGHGASNGGGRPKRLVPARL